MTYIFVHLDEQARAYMACCLLFRGEFIDYRDGDINKPEIQTRQWNTDDFHFDNVAKGMLTLFTVATFEGWPE